MCWGSTARRSTTPRVLCRAESFPEETFPVIVALMTNVFDGAAIVRGVLPQPELEEQRIPMLTALLTAGL